MQNGTLIRDKQTNEIFKVTSYDGFILNAVNVDPESATANFTIFGYFGNDDSIEIIAE